MFARKPRRLCPQLMLVVEHGTGPVQELVRQRLGFVNLAVVHVVPRDDEERVKRLGMRVSEESPHVSEDILPELFCPIRLATSRVGGREIARGDQGAWAFGSELGIHLPDDFLLQALRLSHVFLGQVGHREIVARLKRADVPGSPRPPKPLGRSSQECLGFGRPVELKVEACHMLPSPRASRGRPRSGSSGNHRAPGPGSAPPRSISRRRVGGYPCYAAHCMSPDDRRRACFGAGRSIAPGAAAPGKRARADNRSLRSSAGWTLQRAADP